MANLIITIISIALVAVAAIMGAYYGGTAFLQSQTKAYANTLISQGEQITDAWSVYAADHGGSYTLSALATLSVASPNTYLTTVPIAPGQIALSPSVGWTLANLSDISGGTSANYNGVYVALTKDANGASVCKYVAQAIAGSGGFPTQNAVSVSTLPNNVQTTTGRKFDCVYNDAAVSTGPTAGESEWIYYRAQ